MEKYINRELSWLAFNDRVLEEANCASNPLLERVKFLAITASNLDEFFMVRVGGLTLVADAGKDSTDINGLPAHEQLDLIRARVAEMNREQSECFRNLETELANHNIHRVSSGKLTDDQQSFLADYFENEIRSVVAPLAVHSQQDFPKISGARLCICLRVRPGSELKAADDRSEDSIEHRFLVVPLGRSLRRIIHVPSEDGFTYILLEDVIRLFAKELVANDQVLECIPFRITRNADIAVDEDAIDLLRDMQRMLLNRQQGGCVRLELGENPSPAIQSFLKDAIQVKEADIYHIDGPLDFSSLFSLASIKGHRELKDDPWPPQASPEFIAETDIFEIINHRDRILIHPYQAYDPVVDFVTAAANDPDVIAIKQTMYRTARDSRIANALEFAAQSGKHVTVIVELKARFDEARNIQWAQRLEQSGADVIYGVRGLKTHAKMCVVIRRETAGIKRYVHFGTGNYNEATAQLYSDVSFFTANDQLGADAVHVFNAVTGLSVPQPLAKLAAAPINLRETILDMIRIETEHAKKGDTSGIRAKLNSLVDQEIIDALYEASQAGVPIDLNVRGICCLRAGIKKLSKTIRVVSILDRFLEHSRIFEFNYGGDRRLFISSADWMNRNLDRRVEMMVPIEDEQCRQRLIDLLDTYFRDKRQRPARCKRMVDSCPYVASEASHRFAAKNTCISRPKKCSTHSPIRERLCSNPTAAMERSVE